MSFNYTKSLFSKETIDKMNFIKIKKVCTIPLTKIKLKSQFIDGRKYLQIVQLVSYGILHKNILQIIQLKNGHRT